MIIKKQLSEELKNRQLKSGMTVNMFKLFRAQTPETLGLLEDVLREQKEENDKEWRKKLIKILFMDYEEVFDADGEPIPAITIEELKKELNNLLK